MFIAEVSSNHNRSKQRCLDFVRVAAEAGFDAVKFQAFKIDELFSPEILEKSKMHRDREMWEFPLEFLPDIRSECEKYNIKLGITPFYLQAVYECFEFVDFYKIASYELTWHKLIEACAATKKPLIISTGMADLNEVEAAVTAAREGGALDLEVLHCVSNYPAHVDSLNLSAIATMRNHFNLKVGWSDHSNLESAVLAAVLKWGAHSVEMHLDIDGDGEEFGPGHCWLPDSAHRVIQICREAATTAGSGIKQSADSEQQERLWRSDPADGLRPFKSIRDQYKSTGASH